MADEEDKKPQVQLAVSNNLDAKAKSNAGRPSVVSLSYPDKKSLQKAYMPFLKGGGLFLPTSTTRDMNEEIFLLVTLPESTKPIPVPGIVVWKTPKGAVDSKQQGVGIEFKGREGNSLRSRIEGLLGARVTSSSATHTM
ncbi:MAG: PilZ domain-containing protein [Acidiferrobacterales bacterium]|nr:PilZ domain-containing protein [Acidiferrobacterales bacterium]